MMRSRARSGTRCTKPSRSWFESRKPMPRPMPVSKYEARARHVERDHALVRVPDVDHAVQLLVGRLDRVVREQLRPVVGAAPSSPRRPAPACENFAISSCARLLVDDARLLPLLVARDLDVAEREDERLLLAGRERDVQAVRARSAASRWPPSSTTAPLRGDLRLAPARCRGRGTISRSVSKPATSARSRCRTRSGRAARGTRSCGRACAVALDLDLAGREVALVVGHVVVGVPQAPLDEREHLQALAALAPVFLSVSWWISAVCPSGTSISSDARTPLRSPVMRV